MDIERNDPPLFERFEISYEDFAALDDDGKMRHVRDYWRERLPPGEHLWWLEPSHTLPINVRLYTHLPQAEKRMYRAEAALLCPQICKGPRSRRKYEDAAMYLLTYHGVFCPQARDLFSAGSVALRTDETRGGNYLLRALQDIEQLMIDAARRLPDALFVEYWDESCDPRDRIARWLALADAYASRSGWVPSTELFR